MSIFEAYYFITYTATTIGFGEIPYAFTHSQRIWVSMSIYMTVIGWFYSIGVVMTLLQDKLFLHELAKAKFKRQIQNVTRPFVIILGYSYVTNEIIKKIQKSNLRAIVIERDQDRANMLMLEGFTPHVPVLVADAHQITSLELAGINKINCKAVISLFEDDNLNLRVALTARSLNNRVTLAIKSTSNHHTENLMDIGVEIIENPFSIIAHQIQMALDAPNLLKVEQWIYKIGSLNDPLPKLPKGKYLICGYGRMGHHIFEVFEENGIESVLIEINDAQKNTITAHESSHLLFADGDDKDNLLKAGIEQCVAIIAGTDDDTVNLSILTTARKLNKEIATLVRENEIEDYSIFINANIDHIFMPAKILIHKTSNAILHPLADTFVRLITRQDEAWGQSLVNRLTTTINDDPQLFEVTINKRYSPQIYNYINDNQGTLKIDIFQKSLRNRMQKNNIVPLLIKNKETCTLLPRWDEEIKLNDTMLFACDENARDDMRFIAKNMYEFQYILTGNERKTFFNFNKG
ncbi:MAG: NAD(P)-binding protein [Campylobacterota bacterium]|nr:NAD(P)-binding protein [Campylobacterota bacterium]